MTCPNRNIIEWRGYVVYGVWMSNANILRTRVARNNFPVSENKVNIFSSLFSPPTSPVSPNSKKIDVNHNGKMSEIDFSATERKTGEKVKKKKNTPIRTSPIVIFSYFHLQ